MDQKVKRHIEVSFNMTQQADLQPSYKRLQFCMHKNQILSDQLLAFSDYTDCSAKERIGVSLSHTHTHTQCRKNQVGYIKLNNLVHSTKA